VPEPRGPTIAPPRSYHNHLGVPMTVKESFDVAGLATTWGVPGLRNNVASQDAAAVRALLRNGAVVFGKTNVPVSLADWQSYNPVYGAASNPWDTSRTPGGSSGGSAAAVAAGLAALEIGSDIGGSIRVPAHFCGVFGHKPTWGLCPGRGQSLVKTAAATDIAGIGPLARSARDLRLALDALAGPDPIDTDLTVNLPEPRAGSLRDLRIAVWAEEPGHATSGETTALIEALAGELERAGATVSPTARPAIDPTEAYRVYLALLNAAWSARVPEEELVRQREKKARLRPEDASADAVMLRAVDLSHRDWLHLNERRHQIRRAWADFLRDWDALLCPAFATPALPHMQQGATWERTHTIDDRTIPYNDMLFWPGITCGFHLPASVAPIGVSAAGLPIGVQIVGPLFGDRTTIRVAELIEQAGHGFVAPPGWN